MNYSIQNLPKNWAFIYIGLQNNWLSVKEALAIINQDLFEEEQEDFIVNLNLLHTREELMDAIEEKQVIDKATALSMWQLVFLLAIEESSLSLDKKLARIAEEWARLDYPEQWESFIHYMPNEHSNTPAEVYHTFQHFLHKEEDRLRQLLDQ